MRTLKELLSLLYLVVSKNPDFREGLCFNIRAYLYKTQEITMNEYELLLDYVDDNRPKWYQKGYDKKQKKSSYYWPMHSKQPRLDWLKKHIEKQK